MMPSAGDSPLLRMKGITKRFGTTVALDGVDFSVARGEVHALVGENGAGKSTLVKLLIGAYHRDAGTISIDGVDTNFETPGDAQDAGICAVHQEIHLLGLRSVAENIYTGREPVRWGLVDWPRMNADAAALLSGLGLDIDPRAMVSTLNPARQQMVAIARGVSLGAKILVLDEPTTSLSDREVTILHELIRQLRDKGTSIIYISHRFDELYAVCDRVTVLRDGRLVATRPLAGLERLDLVCLMLGKTRDQLRQGTTGFAGHSVSSDGFAHSVSALHTSSAHGVDAEAPLLVATSLARGARLRDVSFTVKKGEIVGLAGLLGSGRTETVRAVFGAESADGGSMLLRGTPFSPATPHEGIEAGIGFVSEDRKAEGIIPELSVRENLTLAILPLLTRFGVVSRARQSEVVERYMTRLGIRASSADQPIRELSGGNQQKVLIARALCMKPALLILDEPTRGIDIGAKGEIQALVNELAADGLGVLMVSSEVEELVEGSTRVVILRDGRSVSELGAGEISESAIVHALAGHA
ncbi:MAG: sugar ABC transporter ATP-binding protein [Gemmatimonadota bacterium]|nr:sugar ABC transporter ATP-binding protein [Gemmatimonadota bacterium]